LKKFQDHILNGAAATFTSQVGMSTILFLYMLQTEYFNKSYMFVKDLGQWKISVPYITRCYCHFHLTCCYVHHFVITDCRKL